MDDETHIEESQNEPKEDLKDTTKDLIKEALETVNDSTKPWYKRGGSYILALILLIVFYLGDKVGDNIINFFVNAIQSLLGSF